MGGGLQAHYGPGLAALGGHAPGSTLRFQVWYADSPEAACGTGFNLSNALLVTFGG